MMTKLDYLLFSIKHLCFYRKAWIVSAFSIVNETEAQKAEKYIGKLIREPFGLFYLDELLQSQPIDFKTDVMSALFSKSKEISIKQTDFPFIQEPVIKTTIGRLLLNLIVVREPFSGRLSYINKRFNPGAVENMISATLEDTPLPGVDRKPGIYYVDEYIKFAKAVTFIENMSTIFTNSITRVAMLPAPGREAFTKKVLEKYQGKLRSPIEMAKFQEELREFDNAYLKENDPAYGQFTSGPVISARNKAFMTQGGESNDFIGQLDVTPIIQPLDQGIDLAPEAFTAAANVVRYGSFARGAETVNGGVAAKALMTALDTWKIEKEDCGATLGISLSFTELNIKELIWRYILINGKPIFIENEEQAKPFIGKTIFVRSPQYCRLPGTETCKVCAGKAISKYPTGQVIPAMEVSSGIMSDSLKKMHNTGITTKVMDLNSVIS